MPGGWPHCQGEKAGKAEPRKGQPVGPGHAPRTGSDVLKGRVLLRARAKSAGPTERMRCHPKHLTVGDAPSLKEEPKCQCVCTRISVYVREGMCVRVHVCMCARVCAHVCACLSTRVCTYLCVCTHVHVCARVYMCVRTCVRMCDMCACRHGACRT